MKKIIIFLIVVTLGCGSIIFLVGPQSVNVEQTATPLKLTSFLEKFRPKFDLVKSATDIQFYRRNSSFLREKGYTFELYKFSLTNQDDLDLFLSKIANVDDYEIEFSKSEKPSDFFDRVKKYEDFLMIINEVSWFQEKFSSKLIVGFPDSFPRLFIIADIDTNKILMACQYK